MNDTSSLPLQPALPAAAPADRFRYLRHAAVVLGFAGVVGLALGLVRGHDYGLQIVYSEAIGLCIWACTDFGSLLFRRDPETNWPSGWRAVVLHLGAVVIGYTAGTLIGDRFCGCSTFDAWRDSARTFAAYLVLCIAVSAAISFVLLTRGRDQRRLRQIAMAQRDASEAQLKLLESQLEPHMLFNTLANLRALIGVDPPRAQAMLDQLIRFLRATLRASREPQHPLGAEFGRLSDYLELMRVRMGDRLRTRVDLPAELAALPLPPLLLQPLVENAIQHGLEPHVGAGRVEVSAQRIGATLHLQVRDTGAGLDAARPTDGAGFGLTQVRQRLATVYGDAARLDLGPADDPDGGTVATVTLPIAP